MLTSHGNYFSTTGPLLLHWRHNGHSGVSNHQPHYCLLNRVFGCRSKKHQSSASLVFVWGIHRGPVNSPHKGPVTRKMFPFDDGIMVRKCSGHRWISKVPVIRGLAVFFGLHDPHESVEQKVIYLRFESLRCKIVIHICWSEFMITNMIHGAMITNTTHNLTLHRMLRRDHLWFRYAVYKMTAELSRTRCGIRLLLTNRNIRYFTGKVANPLHVIWCSLAFLCMKYHMSIFSHLHCIKSNLCELWHGYMIIVYHWKWQGYSV